MATACDQPPEQSRTSGCSRHDVTLVPFCSTKCREKQAGVTRAVGARQRQVTAQTAVPDDGDAATWQYKIAGTRRTRRHERPGRRQDAGATKATSQKRASAYFPRLAVNFLSNRSLCIVPVIESPSTVAEYSIVNVPFGVSRLMVKLILLPATVPSNEVSPRGPLSVPLIVAASCWIVSVCVMGPLRPSEVICQVPATLAGVSCATIVPRNISKPQASNSTNKNDVLFMQYSSFHACRGVSISLTKQTPKRLQALSLGSGSIFESGLTVLPCCRTFSFALVFIFFSCGEDFLRASLGPGWLELPIADCRLPNVDCRSSIADRHWKELPHHLFNRQSAIVNQQSTIGNQPAALCPGHMEVSSREHEKPCESRGFSHRWLAGVRAAGL